jgi:integrase
MQQAEYLPSGQERTEQSRSWHWPVDPSAYEPRLAFSQQELLELEQMLARQQLPPMLPTTFEQLMQPIYALFEHCTPSLDIRLHARRLMVVEMYRRRTPFWGWTHREWSEILCGSAVAFEEHYPGSPDCRRLILTVAYLLCNFADFQALGEFSRKSLSDTLFGKDRMQAVLQRSSNGVHQWGSEHRTDAALNSVVREMLLLNRSPYLEDLTFDFLLTQLKRVSTRSSQTAVITLSRALMGLGLFNRALSRQYLNAGDSRYRSKLLEDGTSTVAVEWVQHCQRWYATSTLSQKTRSTYYRLLLQVGRWLTQKHPEKINPGSWTREFAATFVAFVDQMRIGEWAEPENVWKIPDQHRVGQPVGPRFKAHIISATRAFFRDCQEWEWISRRFDPHRCLAVPHSVNALIGPDPRVIQMDVWAKLLWAGLNLTQEDIASWTNSRYRNQKKRYVIYPLEMVRAMVIVWLFCGIRSDEWCRLRIGCVRWQQEDVLIPGTEEVLPKEAVCMLDIPTHKTGTSFTKPVDQVVGEAILLWERIRPTQSPRVDLKTSEEVHFLFSYRDKHPQKSYINNVLIPQLCKKCGMPRQDARGNITSHRARSTIATQLFNAAEPMSLFELQEWLGHRYIGSTQQYAKLSPTRLAKSKAKAEYFERNLRLIDVLIDQDAIRSGAAADGQPWRYYDLGHGLCTYDFFDTCPHRMACAKCSFYVPKGSSLEQIIEGKANLLRMKQELSLTEEELAAVDDGLTALDTLQEKLADVPTPAGPTPRQLETSDQQSVFIAVQTVQRKPSKERK